MPQCHKVHGVSHREQQPHRPKRPAPLKFDARTGGENEFFDIGPGAVPFVGLALAGGVKLIPELPLVKLGGVAAPLPRNRSLVLRAAAATVPTGVGGGGVVAAVVYSSSSSGLPPRWMGAAAHHRFPRQTCSPPVNRPQDYRGSRNQKPSRSLSPSPSLSPSARRLYLS